MTFKVVGVFERDAGRLTIPVSHLRSADSFGCDLVGVASEAVRDKAMTEQSLAEADIVRYIAGKGCGSPTGKSS